MRVRHFSRLSWILALAVGVAGCDESGPASLDNEDTTLSLYLTDAPGDVAAVWINIDEVFFQGGPGGRLMLLDEPTGLIELTELVGISQSLVSDLAVEPGSYRQLRFVLGSAVLETSDGDVYSFGGADHPGGVASSGDLMCPGCAQSGLKVKLANGQLDVGEGENGLVLDFDVSQSFGRMAGNSGKWIMKPVIHAVPTQEGDDPENPEAGSSIQGTVALESGVELPQCPAGQERSLSDFVPTATALTLTDGDGGAIVRSGSVADTGIFEIGSLDPDSYALAFESELTFDAFKLVWQATVDPAQVDVGEGTTVEGVSYSIAAATCEAVAG